MLAWAFTCSCQTGSSCPKDSLILPPRTNSVLYLIESISNTSGLYPLRSEALTNESVCERRQLLHLDTRCDHCGVR